MSDITQSWRYARETISEEACESGRRLSERRRQRGFTMGDVSRRTGISVPRVSDIEFGRAVPTPEELAKLEEMLSEVPK